MSEPIPFPGRPQGLPADTPDDDATEVTLDGAPGAPGGPITTRLPGEPDLFAVGLSDVLLAPLELLPAETRTHLRAAGREASLAATSLAGTLLKGAGIALNIAGEALKDYSARNSKVTDLDTARQRRQRVEIEVE